MQELEVANHDLTPTGVITKSRSYEGTHRGKSQAFGRRTGRGALHGVPGVRIKSPDRKTDAFSILDVLRIIYRSLVQSCSQPFMYLQREALYKKMRDGKKKSPI